MPAWLEEFLILTDASRRLQVALWAIPVIPLLIVVIGALLLKPIAADGPYAPLIGAVREGALHIYLAVALVALVSYIRFAAKEYRRARKRLLG